MPVAIVKATAGDYENILPLYAEVHELHRSNLPWRFASLENEVYSKAYFSEVIVDDNRLFLLAKDEGQVVGFATAKIEKSPDLEILQPRNFVLLNVLATAGGYRQQGIGTMLMAEVEKWASEKGLSDIELNVWQFNQIAIEFYRRQGFEAVSQRMRKVL